MQAIRFGVNGGGASCYLLLEFHLALLSQFPAVAVCNSEHTSHSTHTLTRYKLPYCWTGGIHLPELYLSNIIMLK